MEPKQALLHFFNSLDSTPFILGLSDEIVFTSQNLFDTLSGMNAKHEIQNLLGNLTKLGRPMRIESGKAFGDHTIAVFYEKEKSNLVNGYLKNSLKGSRQLICDSNELWFVFSITTNSSHTLSFEHCIIPNPKDIT